ncbi:MAG: sigma-70 family RNA polymerase sigma factor [Deltaproteobacteria bacterium]|nr:sigma-70 family RNA polymerase sigma factor [Deltaproteobacteria bacterium]
MEGKQEINPEAWVDEYGDVLFGFALARVKDRETAEDIVQETFLAAVRAREQFKGQSSEKTWLFGILKHKLVDHYRKNKSTVHVQDFIQDPDSLEAFFNAKGSWRIRPENWRADPGKSQENREFLDHFYRCLSGLSQKTADVFAYREIEGLSTREICQRLGITLSNCWVILYRARMLLRRCLEGVGFGQKHGGDIT